MNMQDYVSIIAQTGDGELIKEGLVKSTGSAIGIDPELGLLVLAQDAHKHANGAMKSVEILLDDMQLNMPAAGQDSNSAQTASNCLRESLDNINEYLLSLSQKNQASSDNCAVSLIALQFLQHQCSVIAVGDYQCVLLHQQRLHYLVPEAPTDYHVGQDYSIQALISEPNILPGDILLVLNSSVLASIGEDFVRITLARFVDNLEMVVRQINTRVSRQGMSLKPELIICRMLPSGRTEPGWLDKLGIH